MSAITQAASVLLAGGPTGAELFVVERTKNLRFFGGFLAFPGGKVAPTDADVPVVPAAAEANGPRADPARYVAAARELFEETGVLIARTAHGDFPPYHPEQDAWRHDLMAERCSFGELLSQQGLILRAADFTPIGNLVTPSFAPVRFDTSFFFCQLPAGQRAEVWAGELDTGRWSSAADVLAGWRRGECLVSPPTVFMLEALADQPVAETARRLAPLFAAHETEVLPPIFLAPAVQVIPLRTLALPPSTHTNAYLVGSGPVLLLDPGPTDPVEQQTLFRLIDEQADRGRRLTAIVLTHHHPDHIGAVAACVERYQLPVWAHPLTAQALEGKLAVDREIQDGERLDLGSAPGATGSWWLEAIHTPGHAPGHLAFHERRYGLLFAGDMVSTQASIVIPPREGDLTAYLHSLQRLREFASRLLLPSHGSASSRPQETIDECLVHRQKREEMLVDALGQGMEGLDELARELYKGVPDHLLRFAQWQVLAGLRKLHHEGRATPVAPPDTQRWRLLAATPGMGLR